MLTSLTKTKPIETNRRSNVQIQKNTRALKTTRCVSASTKSTQSRRREYRCFSRTLSNTHTWSLSIICVVHTWTVFEVCCRVVIRLQSLAPPTGVRGLWTGFWTSNAKSDAGMVFRRSITAVKDTSCLRRTLTAKMLQKLNKERDRGIEDEMFEKWDFSSDNPRVQEIKTLNGWLKLQTETMLMMLAMLTKHKCHREQTFRLPGFSYIDGF